MPVLCYHDVRDDVHGDLDEDSQAVSTRALVEQFDWLLAHGYTPLSASDLRAAEKGEIPLPERPILLTFDDGYASFYHRVLPLLRAYRFPALLSVVGSWMEVPPGGSVDYAGTPVPRERFLSWQQLRDVAASPWVEIASHSFDLHRGVLANRAGNTQPAANTRIFDPAAGDIETLEELQRRVGDDLERNRALLEERLGRAPRFLAWPYGEAAGWAFDLARDAGFEATLLLGDELAVLPGGTQGRGTLGGGPRDGTHSIDTYSIGTWQRILVQGNPSLGEWVAKLREPVRWRPVRALHLSLSDLAGGRREGDESRLSLLVQRLVDLGITSLHLDADGDPAWANRVAWQVRTRAGAHVWLRLPATADSESLGEWASRVPVRGWLLDAGPDERPVLSDDLARFRAALGRYQSEARLALALPSAAAGLELLSAHGTALDVDHLVLPIGTGQGSAPFPATLDPALRRLLVPWVGRRPEAEPLARLQGQGILGLAVEAHGSDLDAPWLVDIRRWISSEIFPYPRP